MSVIMVEMEGWRTQTSVSVYESVLYATRRKLCPVRPLGDAPESYRDPTPTAAQPAQPRRVPSMHSLWGFPPDVHDVRLREVERDLSLNPRPMLARERLDVTKNITQIGNSRIHPLIEMDLFATNAGGVHRHPHLLYFCSFVDIDLADHSQHVAIYLATRLWGGERAARLLTAFQVARPAAALAARLFTASSLPPGHLEMLEMIDLHCFHFNPTQAEARPLFANNIQFMREVKGHVHEAFALTKRDDEFRVSLFLVMAQGAFKPAYLREFFETSLLETGVSNRKASLAIWTALEKLSTEHCRLQSCQIVNCYRIVASRYDFSPLGDH